MHTNTIRELFQLNSELGSNDGLEPHWIEHIREFSDKILHEMRRFKDQIKGIDIELSESTALDSDTKSLWVDGGSAFTDLIGGSLYVVKAAAGLFEPDQPVKWYEKTDVGFTSLPRNVDRLVGLKRNILEIECILELLNHKPDFVILDNGLASYATMGVPHSTLQYFSKPVPDDSPQYEYFQSFMQFMKRYDILIQQCQVLDIPLIGAAKDPRSRVLSRKFNLGKRFTDTTLVSLLAGERVGFTSPIDASYLEIPRVKQYLLENDILTEGRGKFRTMYGILKPRAPVFRLDYLEDQEKHLESIRRFMVSMHDGNGYLLPSHIVHNKATIPKKLANSLEHLIVSSIAKKDMPSAQFIFGSQRRSRFG